MSTEAVIVVPRYLADDPGNVAFRVVVDRRHAERRKGVAREGGNRRAQRRSRRPTFQAAVMVLR